MLYPKVLTIQDISCVGQCSLTAALPILSAAGAETCILPSAVLSTHTGGFTGFTFRDLTEDMPAIAAHWKKEGIAFDAVYTGYLGSIRQIGIVQDIFRELRKPGAKTFVDPAMADNGVLYSIFDMPYRETYDEAYITEILDKMEAAGAKTIILTGITYKPETTGVIVVEDGKRRYYEHKRIERGCHGTGDVYASAFVGAYLRGMNAFEAAKLAADFTVRSIENTLSDESHWYGVKFETALPMLIEALKLAD